MFWDRRWRSEQAGGDLANFGGGMQSIRRRFDATARIAAPGVGTGGSAQRAILGEQISSSSFGVDLGLARSLVRVAPFQGRGAVEG